MLTGGWKAASPHCLPTLLVDNNYYLNPSTLNFKPKRAGIKKRMQPKISVAFSFLYLTASQLV